MTSTLFQIIARMSADNRKTSRVSLHHHSFANHQQQQQQYRATSPLPLPSVRSEVVAIEAETDLGLSLKAQSQSWALHYISQEPQKMLRTSLFERMKF